MFLIGDAVASAEAGQKVPSGSYNVATMVGSVLRHGGAVGVCGSCIDARGIGETELLEGARRSSIPSGRGGGRCCSRSSGEEGLTASGSRSEEPDDG